ncbi:family 16 glycoside hydrolase [Streptomyces sp. NPDC051657]|uniref:family 16 glycoside hydrolase n=1 Tax=Streptomyces sp. NPDC051657 TaxID=3154749 RepID=UPI003416580F
MNLDSLTVTPTKRTTLFDGTDLDAWEANDGSPAKWPVADGSVESLGGDIRTKEKFGDFRMHAEWYQPQEGPGRTGDPPVERQDGAQERRHRRADRGRPARGPRTGPHQVAGPRDPGENPRFRNIWIERL